MAAGFYCLQRGWMDSPAFRRETFNRHSAWVWLTEKAAFRPTEAWIGGKSISVPRGSYVCSLRALAREWDWQINAVRRFLDALERGGLIQSGLLNKMTMISICGYGSDPVEMAIKADQPPVQTVVDAPPPRGDFVYVICVQTKTGILSAPVKIGISVQPEERLRDLQVASAFPLAVVKKWKAGETARTVERALHRHFSKYRLSGEWFDVAPDLVCTTIETNYFPGAGQAHCGNETGTPSDTLPGTPLPAEMLEFLGDLGTPLKANPAQLPSEPGTHKEKRIRKKKEDDPDGSLLARTRKQAVPENWIPTDSGRTYAENRAGWAGSRVDLETEHFRDHHLKNGNKFINLDAAWRTWVQQGAKFQVRNAGGINGTRPDREQRKREELDHTLSLLGVGPVLAGGLASNGPGSGLVGGGGVVIEGVSHRVDAGNARANQGSNGTARGHFRHSFEF